MGSSSNIVRAVREATPGTTPAGSMTVILGTFDPGSGGYAKTKGIDVQGSRMTPGHVPGSKKPTWSGEADGRFQAHQIYREGVMCATRTAAITPITGTDITVVASGSGNKLTRTGGWAGIINGDTVEVTTPANGTFLAAGVTVSGNDLVIPTAYKALTGEAAGVSVTVSRGNRYRLGTSLLTHTAELWNPNATPTARGHVFRGCGVTGWKWGWDHPGGVKQSFNGISMTRDRITSRLANASVEVTKHPIMNSGSDFGDKLRASRGGFLRYGGTLLTDMLVSKLEFELKNELQVYEGGGSLDAQAIDLDGMFELMVNLSIVRNSAHAEDLLDDANDQTTVTSLGWCQADGTGNREYFYLPRLVPGEEKVPGVQQSGKDMADIPFMAEDDGVVGLIQITEFPAA